MSVGNTWVYGVRLEDAVKERAPDELDFANPYRDPEAPALFLGWLHEPPESRFPDDDFSESGHQLVRRYGSRLVEECRSRHSNREGALSAHEDRVVVYRGRGWAVITPEIERTFNVYVVELEDSVVESRPGLLKENPDRDPDLPPLYVGMTSREPFERFRIHKEGGRKASSYVYEFGRHLRPDLYRWYNPSTELEAFRKERRLARTLRNCGFTVAGGH